MDFKDIEFKGLRKTEDELIQLFYFKFQDIPLLKRMDAVMEYFVDEFETLRDRDLSDEEREYIQEKFDRMYVTKDIYVIYNWLMEDCGYPRLRAYEAFSGKHFEEEKLAELLKTRQKEQAISLKEHALNIGIVGARANENIARILEEKGANVAFDITCTGLRRKYLLEPRTFAKASSLSPWIVRTGFKFSTVPTAAAAGVMRPPRFRYFRVSTAM